MRRIFVRLQGAITGAWLHYVTVIVTPKTGKNDKQGGIFFDRNRPSYHYFLFHIRKSA